MHYIEDGLMVHETGGPSVWFKLALRRRELLSFEEIQQEIERETQRIAALTGHDCHLIGVPRGYSVEDWSERLRGVTPHANEGFEELADEMANRIVSSEIQRREVYLGIYLHKEEKRDWTGWRTLMKGADRFLSTTDPRPDARQLEEWKAQLAYLRPKLDVGGLGGDVATAADLRWLLGRTFWRGLPHIQFGESRSCWGGEAQALLEGAVVENHHGYLRVMRPLPTTTAKVPVGEFWVAILGYSRFPDRLPETGGEWLYAYEELGIPVEFSCRFRVLAQSESVNAMSRVVKRTIDQVRHIEEVPGTLVPRDLADKNEHAQDLQFRVTQEREALVNCWPRVMVTAGSREELQERVHFLQSHYHDYLQIELAVPTGDQLRLFKEFVPGSPFELRESYPQDMNVPALAGAGATANTNLGDVEGPYIGRTSTGGNPVTFDPHRATRINQPPLIFVGGRLGSGKSNAAYLLIEEARARGASTVLVDPKGEADGLMRRCAHMGNGINCIRLDQVGAGILDPFRFYHDKRDASALASTMLQSMLGDGIQQVVRNAIQASAGEAAKADHPSLRLVVETMRTEFGSNVDVRAAATALEAISESQVGRSCFSLGESPDLNLHNALTVLQFRGLDLPPAGMSPSTYTDANRVATAIVHAMAACAGRVMWYGQWDYPKMIVYDDAFSVLQNEVGRGVLLRDVLQGRSLNTVSMVISQNASHLIPASEPDGAQTLASNLGAAFIFRLPDREEAKAGCRVLGIPPDEWNIHTVQRLGPEADDYGELPGFSECIFRDAAGNVGRLQIDLMSDDRIAAFCTTPGRADHVQYVETAVTASGEAVFEEAKE